MRCLQHLVKFLGNGQRRVTIERRFDADIRPERRRALGRAHSISDAFATSATLDNAPANSQLVEE
ncbi:hypothetical protein ACBJ59_57975 [Nonomuraea sp. MTCD27]|uniref:hypothetical protein n=1 Tax=Nonomuraea sp. MTCD27 TaxID=1676747 RepID=UPI0035C160F5